MTASNTSTQPHGSTQDQIAEMESEGQAQTHGEQPAPPSIAPQDPSSMPRAEDDAEAFERSPEFHDRPGGTNDVPKRE